jgi:hypothetical protein
MGNCKSESTVASKYDMVRTPSISSVTDIIPISFASVHVPPIPPAIHMSYRSIAILNLLLRETPLTGALRPLAEICLAYVRDALSECSLDLNVEIIPGKIPSCREILCKCVRQPLEYCSMCSRRILCTEVGVPLTMYGSCSIGCLHNSTRIWCHGCFADHLVACPGERRALYDAQVLAANRIEAERQLAMERKLDAERTLARMKKDVEAAEARALAETKHMHLKKQQFLEESKMIDVEILALEVATFKNPPKCYKEYNQLMLDHTKSYCEAVTDLINRFGIQIDLSYGKDLTVTLAERRKMLHAHLRMLS